MNKYRSFDPGALGKVRCCSTHFFHFYNHGAYAQCLRYERSSNYLKLGKKKSEKWEKARKGRRKGEHGETGRD